MANPPTGKAPELRPGRHYDERHLAAAARHRVAADPRTAAEIAAALPISGTPKSKAAALSMALNFDKYPDRGHAVRRAVLAMLAGVRIVDGFSRVEEAEPSRPDGRTESGGGTADPDSADPGVTG